MFMPFSLGKNQDRTIWSENKIWWRNYCKVRSPCFLSVSSFRVSLIFLFCICLLERDEMREAQASKFLENMVIIWPPMEKLLVFIFSSPQQDTSGTHTAAFLVSFSGASSVYLFPLYISCILFRNRAVSEIRYSLWSSILVKTKLHSVNYFCLTLRHCGSFLFWGSSACSARFTPNYREQHFGQIFLVFK